MSLIMLAMVVAIGCGKIPKPSQQNYAEETNPTQPTLNIPEKKTWWLKSELDKALAGKTKTEIEKVLGKPYNTYWERGQEVLEYRIGLQVNPNVDITPELKIYLQNNKYNYVLHSRG